MRILITGAAGYIGAVLTDELIGDGHEVTAYDNFSRGKGSLLQCCSHARFRYVQGDVRDRVKMAAAVGSCDAIVSLAALVSPQACVGNAEKAQSINVDSIAMLNELRSPAQPLLFMSTNIGYGTKSRKDVYTELDPLEPNSIYGLTKVEAERIISGKPGFVIYRPASAFGISPGMKDHLLLNFYTSRAVEDGSLVVYDAEFKRNFIHVRDIARCVSFTISHFDRMRDNVYNIGISDGGTTKMDLAQAIKRQLGELPIHCHSNSTDPDRRDYVISNAKIEAKGFKCRYSIDDGIRELIGYYRMRNLISSTCPAQTREKYLSSAA
jgi:nucleoside-diphosphate-sugar epimerase